HTRSKRDWSSDVCSSDLEGDLLCLLVALNPERKGLNTLLESLPRLPRHAKLLVVGVGEHQLSMYEQLAINHGLEERILFVPQTRSEERRVGKECRKRRSE